jgi:uncharacterized protein involved in oxidation of intracellular sulfur
VNLGQTTETNQIMKYLFILNDPPYGTERSYNGLRLAMSLAKSEDDVSVFLMGDAASCSVAGQITASGYYNIERMLKSLAARTSRIGVCGTCMDARGIKPENMIPGTRRSSMEELTSWTVESDKVIVF